MLYYCACAAEGVPAMVAVMNDPHAALVTRSCAAGALRHFLLSEARAPTCLTAFVTQQPEDMSILQRACVANPTF